MTGAVAEARVTCGCSKMHIYAQELIQRHVSRLRVQTWRACGKHPAGIWRAADDVRVSLEQSAVFNGRRVRYDVAVHEAGRLAKVIEVRGSPRTSCAPPSHPAPKPRPSQVRHTSETRPEKRPPNTIELRAEDVVLKLDSGDGPTLLDNLMTADEPCPECEAEAAEAAQKEQQRRLLALEAEKQREAAAAEAAQKEQQRRLLALEAEKQREAAREAEAAEAAQKEQQRRLLALEAEKQREAAREAEAAEAAQKYAASAEFERRRYDAAVRMAVKATPGYSRSIGTDVPEVSKEEIDRRRQERLARQAASQGTSKRGRYKRRRT